MIEYHLGRMFSLSNSATTFLALLAILTPLILAEIISLKIPSIIIPFQNSLDDHQSINSDIISKNKVGWVINEKEFKLDEFNLIIKKLILNRNIIKNIKNKFLILEKKNYA